MREKLMTNILLVAEGPAATGKTFVLRKVKAFLQSEGFEVGLITEGTPIIGNPIRSEFMRVKALSLARR